MISHNRKSIARTIGADHDPVRGELLWARAACRDYDPDLWFPVGNPATDAAVWDKPRAVCNTCPMKAECLKDAIERKDTWGMCGGKTPQELDKLIKRKCKDCGEPAADGRRHCTPCAEARIAAGEVPCAGCGDLRHIRARGLCIHCWIEDVHARRDEEVRLTVAERAEAVHSFLDQGLSTGAIAKRMGLQQRSVQRIIARATARNEIAS